MKKAGKWVLSVVSKVLIIIAVVLLLPFAHSFFQKITSNINGEIIMQSKILEQKLASSKRLEVTTVEEEGILEAKTNVVILGTVGSTTIRYRYTASVGIDLSKVIMTIDSDRIVFFLPDIEILNDGIEALEINRHNLFSKAIEKSIETLLSEQRIKCREEYKTNQKYTDRTRQDTVAAFEETICQWLDSYGERQYQFEYLMQHDSKAEIATPFCI